MLVQLRELIMDRVYDLVIAGKDIEKMCQELSWISPDWIEDPIPIGEYDGENL